MSVSPRPPASFVQTPAWTASAPKTTSNSVVVAGADGKIRAFSEKSGEAIWESKALEETVDFRVSDKFVVSQDRRSLASLSADDGKLLWKRHNPGDLVALKDQVVLTNKYDKLQAIDLESGEFRWQSPSHSKPLVVGDNVLLVTGQKNSIETLEARNADTGELAWSTSDGDIDHVVSSETSVLYSSQKLGKHAQKIQLLSNRDHQGKIKWNHQAPGLLRQAPKFSPDGQRVALTGRDPADGSKSYLTVLDAETGEFILSTRTDFEVQISFLNNGSLVLSETEFTRVPGEEKRSLRAIDAEGYDLWTRPGNPDWVMSGDHLVISESEQLLSLDPDNGSILWRRDFPGNLKPVSSNGDQLAVIHHGCQLMTLNATTGEPLDNVSTGDGLFIGEGLVGDHEGRYWSQTLPSPTEQIAGKLPDSKLFHIPFLSGPIERGNQDAVFVDWDGDEMATESDPILLNRQRQTVSWSELQARDADGHAILKNDQLKDLSLWFDSDKDGSVSSAGELTPLLENSSFDKARLELEKNQLWLASDSTCN